ncbi:hypothetical protein [Aequorivita sp. Q41]|uniref:hypothetical protein n=1 Tax=Aequorivita sp. Q41 TaxID=3153300 RepID=UPI00324288FD
MIKGYFLIGFFTFISCNSSPDIDEKFSTDFSRDFGMYTVFINEFESTTFHLNKLIEQELNLKLDDSFDKIHKYDSLTKEYIGTLKNLELELIKNSQIENFNNIKESQKAFSSIKEVNDYFFIGDSLTNNGNIYLEKRRTYINKLLKLTENPDFTQRIVNNLSVNDAIDRNNNNIKYLNYHYKNTPLIAFVAHNKLVIKKILHLEYDFINE